MRWRCRLTKYRQMPPNLLRLRTVQFAIAYNGAEVVQRTIDGMNTIRDQIQETSKRIKRLGESSQEIGDIVGLINDIADQTNIPCVECGDSGIDGG